MPLQFLRYRQLNFTAWDACVREARETVPYAQSWWLRTVAGRWDAVVETDTAGHYASVLPVPVKWRPWGREAFQPFFTQQLGLLTTVASQRTDVAEYLGLLPDRYARFYQQLNVANGLPGSQAVFTVAARQTYQLDLSLPYTTLAAGYAADYRRRLRVNQQQSQPLVVTEAGSVAALATLFQGQKGDAAGLSGRHYRLLQALEVQMRRHGQSQVLEVRAPETNALLAGALFLHYQSRVVYLFAGASAAGKKAGAPLLLLDHVIQAKAGTPNALLDFEGSMIPSIARFFANFGAAPAPYAALSSLHKPWYLPWMR